MGAIVLQRLLLRASEATRVAPTSYMRKWAGQALPPPLTGLTARSPISPAVRSRRWVAPRRAAASGACALCVCSRLARLKAGVIDAEESGLAGDLVQPKVEHLLDEGQARVAGCKGQRRDEGACEAGGREGSSRGEAEG